MKLIVECREFCNMDASMRYKRLLEKKPDAALGFATGATPLELYHELARLYRAGEISFARARAFNLDEYVGMNSDNANSFRYFMNKYLFGRTDFNVANTYMPYCLSRESLTASHYELLIEQAGGIDLMLLGIGRNGHIGFNEPGTPFGSITHVQQLSEETRAANSRFFYSPTLVPTYAVTMGIATIMHARSIILLAYGREKAQAVHDMVAGPVTESVPASVLQLHPDVTVYADAEAAALL